MKITIFKRAGLLLLLLTVFTATAQNKADEAKIKAIGDKACECTKEIDADQPKDSIVAKINDCISNEILISQMAEKFGTKEEILKEVEALTNTKDTVEIGKSKGKEIVIVMDENFNEIQSYIFDNCERVKILLSLNNGKLEHSMSKNKKALKFYDEGTDYYNREQYDLAIVSFNKAVKTDPKFAFAWDNLGISYRKIGNYKEAIKAYKKSLELDPKGTMPLQNIAVAYEYLKDYKNAIGTYEQLISLHPDNPEGYFGAGRVAYLDENYEKGVDNMFKAFVLYNESKSPYVNDAQQNLQYYYSDLKEKGKLKIFEDMAAKNKVDIN